MLNGGNPAVGIAAGGKSFVYTEGLEKTVISKSSELDVHAINGICHWSLTIVKQTT